MVHQSDEEFESRLLSYAGSAYWLAVREALRDQDRRVMLFGPSAKSGLGRVTYFVAHVLDQFGLEPQMPSEHGTVDFEIGKALEFPYIVSLVRTVGTAAETLTLLHRITDAVGPQPRLLVVVPVEHQFGYFSRAVRQQFHVNLETCSSTTCADDNLAILVLRGIGAMVLSNRQIVRGQELSNVPFPASDQDRKSIASNPGLRRKTWQGNIPTDFASS